MIIMKMLKRIVEKLLVLEILNDFVQHANSSFLLHCSFLFVSSTFLSHPILLLPLLISSPLSLPPYFPFPFSLLLPPPVLSYALESPQIHIYTSFIFTNLEGRVAPAIYVQLPFSLIPSTVFCSVFRLFSFTVALFFVFHFDCWYC